MNDEARQVVATLQLEPLPAEGGFFRVMWRSATASSILFLLTEKDFSALHRIAQDEVWLFHAGDPVEHVRFGDPAGGDDVSAQRLGDDVRHGDLPQLFVPAGNWQGARLASDTRVNRRGFALLSCVVSPPFDDAGFELGAPAALLAQWPQARPWIAALTR